MARRRPWTSQDIATLRALYAETPTAAVAEQLGRGVRAAYLLMESDSPRIRARIIAPGTTAPVMTWTAADGWKEWRA